jgi:hypothetical protein
MDYNKLLKKKRIIFESSGFKISDSDINPILHPFQRDLVRYQVAKGRSACFAETGLGKTPIDYETVRIQQQEIGKPALIFAPLSVAWQMMDDIKDLLDGKIIYQENSDGPLAPINVTNYERLHLFDMSKFGVVSLDESSILKALGSKTRRMLTEMCANVPYRNCYSATPSPNDIVEIGSHAEFLGIMSRAEMKASFFVNRENKQTGEKWTLKAWSENKFYRWLASWGMAVRKPSDLGRDDNGYILPKLNVMPKYIDAEYIPKGQLMSTGLSGLHQRNKVRRETLEQRCNHAAEIVNNSTEQFIVWCYLNDEANMMHKLIPGAINVQGSDSTLFKAETFRDFKHEKFRVLVTKPKIAGFGMNFQQSHNMVFVGLNDSMEAFYQCIRRQWRFMQTHQVNVYIVLAKIQRAILQNVRRKEEQMKIMQQKLINNSRQYALEELGKVTNKAQFVYNPQIKFQLPEFME